MRISTSTIIVLFVLFVLACVAPCCEAGIPSKIAQETAEFVVRKFGKEAAEEGTEALTRRIASLASRFGDDAINAARRVGPKVSRLVDDAAEQAPVALKLLAKHGDDAIRLVARPKQLGLIARFGDDAAECLLKHGEAAEPLLQSFGAPAAKALRGISSQNGRRISMMMADGQLAKLGRSDELLGVIARYGDAGAEFVWKNKGALAVGAGLAAFLTTPETFVNGGTQLTSIVADAAVKPVVAAAAESTPWFAIASLIGLVIGSVTGWKLWGFIKVFRKRVQKDANSVSSINGSHLN